MAEDFVIEMLHITKEFPGIKANDDITLQLRKGEVSVSAPKTVILSSGQSSTSAAICASVVSQPVPISAAPMISE